MQHHQETNK